MMGSQRVSDTEQSASPMGWPGDGLLHGAVSQHCHTTKTIILRCSAELLLGSFSADTSQTLERHHPIGAGDLEPWLDLIDRFS